MKILIIKNDKIGDMILSANIFRELKLSFPKSEITVIASNSNKQIIEKNKNVDKIIIANYPPISINDLILYSKLARKLRAENFDLGIDLRGSIFNIFFFLVLPKVKYKIGFYNRFFSKFFLDYAYKKDRVNKHVTMQRIELINGALKIKSKNYWPEIAVDSEDKIRAMEFIKKNNLKKFICIIPDASLESKQWPLDNWDLLIKIIKKKYSNYKLLISGTDKDKISYLVDKNPSLIYSDIPLNLRELSIVLKKSSLVICHDGGVMHLAWAVKANLIALMPRHLSLNYYRPLGKNSTVISADVKNIPVKELEKKINKYLKN